MVKRQAGKCAICERVPDGSRGTKDRRLHVDHDHSTGRIRDLLCQSCNLLIGFARESPKLLAKASEYLGRHSA